MSIKPKLTYKNLGVLNTEGNPVNLNGSTSRALENIGDLEATGSLVTQPGYTRYLGSPILASYTTGTVAIENGTKTVTGSGTTWTSNAWPGDFFIGPDGTYYVIERVDSNTSLRLRSDYEGDTVASGGTYTIHHRVWMLAQYTGSAGSADITRTQSYISATTGTFTNTRSGVNGLMLTPSIESICTGSAIAGSYQLGGTNATQLARKVTTSGAITTSGMWLPIAFASYPSATVKVTIQANGATPPGTPFTANATSGEITYATQAARSGKSLSWIDFSGSVSLSATTSYWIVVELVSGSITVPYRSSGGTYTNPSQVGTMQYKTSWAASGFTFDAAFVTYPTTGTHSYVSPVFDMGVTPTLSGTLTINKASSVPAVASNGSVANLLSSSFINAEASMPDTLTWTLNTSASANMSSPTQVATGQSGTSYQITGAGNLKRYYQITYDMDSATGRSTPLVTGATISFPVVAGQATETNRHQIVGCGPNIYKQIAASAATIFTAASPSGEETRGVSYQRKLFMTPNNNVAFWDGIAAAIGAVSTETGDDPPASARRIALYGDKLFAYGDATSAAIAGVSGALTNTALTLAAGQTYATDTLKGYRIYPDYTNFIHRYWVCTANTNANPSVLTASGATMLDVGVAGDAYRVHKHKAKTAWYSTEEDPMDWPSTSLLQFDEDDGDALQSIVPRNGRFIVVCRKQVWQVVGYGPTTGWTKDMVSPTGGTVSPVSVVNSDRYLYWWGQKAVMRHAGGNTPPESICDDLHSIVMDVNSGNLADITGTWFEDMLYMSFPTSDSNVNNRTLVFNPRTGMWCLRTFGMYAPCVMNDGGADYLLFQDPTTGCICKYDDGIFFDGQPQECIAKTSFITGSNPDEQNQMLKVRAVINASADETVEVWGAYDYQDSYSYLGTLVPNNATALAARPSVNATDTAYECQLDTSAAGTSISVQLRFAPTAQVKVHHLEVICDMTEADTNG